MLTGLTLPPSIRRGSRRPTRRRRRNPFPHQLDHLVGRVADSTLTWQPVSPSKSDTESTFGSVEPWLIWLAQADQVDLAFDLARSRLGRSAEAEPPPLVLSSLPQPAANSTMKALISMSASQADGADLCFVSHLAFFSSSDPVFRSPDWLPSPAIATACPRRQATFFTCRAPQGPPPPRARRRRKLGARGIDLLRSRSTWKRVTMPA